MSVEPLEIEAALPRARSAVPSAVGLLLMLTGSHFLVDTVACIVMPLWPSLERSLELPPGGILWIVVLWTMSTSITQLAFGFLGDRFHGRWLIWAGPAVSVVCMSSIGLVETPWALALLLVVGGLGTAAFHPEAAAAAGACAPHHRSRAMSIFAIGGYLGQAAGPYYGGVVTHRLGFTGLTWTLTWGLAGIALVAWGVRMLPGPSPTAARVPAVRGQFRGKKRTLGLLLAIATTRVIAASGVPLALAFVLAARQATSEQIGLVQSVLLIGIGAGNLVCALWVGPRAERPVMWALPLCVAPLVAALPFLDGMAQWTAVGLTGLLLGAALPVTISYGQQLLPDGQRVASSITMGVSWGLAGGLVAAILKLAEYVGRADAVFWVFAASLVISTVLCYWLPPIGPRAGAAARSASLRDEA
jgi:FSR family fosmidomycin resistance protein-like MFS transporter